MAVADPLLGTAGGWTGGQNVPYIWSICSMYDISIYLIPNYTYIWVIFVINAGQFSIHGALRMNFHSAHGFLL